MQSFRANNCRSIFLGAVLAIAAAGVVFAANPAHVQQLRETRSCEGCDLSNAELQGAELAHSLLAGANLRGARLYGSNLIHSDFTGANLTGADFSRANLNGATGADLSHAKTTRDTICPNGQNGPCQ